MIIAKWYPNGSSKNIFTNSKRKNHSEKQQQVKNVG